jgi:hypothetical protein
MARFLKQTANGIPFLELLLDETLCQGELWVPKKLIQQAGGINDRLQAKQKYELILRIAEKTEVEFAENPVDKTEDMVLLADEEQNQVAEHGWQTDCYVIGKYSAILREKGLFEAAVSTILRDAAQQGRQEETLLFLEQMIGHAEAFYERDNATRPILVYKGDDVCHNVLTVFAEQFGAALERAGNQVVYFDVSRQPVEELLLYRNQHFKAVIGVQSYLFSVKMKDEVHYLHEYIHGPKFNFIFDHPVWMKKHLEHEYPDFYILTHDKDYVSFVQRYFKKKAYLFPPAGMEAAVQAQHKRIYGLTFVGTYGDYWNEILFIHRMEPRSRFLANRFLLVMRKKPHLSAEEALIETLNYYKMKLDEKAFVEQLYELRRVIYCVIHYYRDRVLRRILESGIRLDVFGDSWRTSPLVRYPNLVCHPDVTVEESLVIWQQSKISLNIMSWHKAGFTERMANIMLAGAVLVTDDTRYLAGEYGQEDMLIFRLEEMADLPEKIKRLLTDEEARNQMAENGREKTRQKHTWDIRAVEFLELLRNDTERGKKL